MSGFQSRNRVSSNFNCRSRRRYGYCVYGFNLVIEYLLISINGMDPHASVASLEFQSRNRVSSNFNNRLIASRTPTLPVRFNLVIEYLLISIISFASRESHVVLCFNLVIEYLLISIAGTYQINTHIVLFQSRNRVSSNFNIPQGGRGHSYQSCFNLVIEYLLISIL